MPKLSIDEAIKEITPRTAIPISFLLGAISLVFYALTTFATIKYVDDKHAQVNDTLKEMKSDQKEIKLMVLNLYQRKGR